MQKKLGWEAKTEQNRQNLSFKNLLKTDRFRSGFPAGLYLRGAFLAEAVTSAAGENWLPEDLLTSRALEPSLRSLVPGHQGCNGGG
jgi:hypothetical protein